MNLNKPRVKNKWLKFHKLEKSNASMESWLEIPFISENGSHKIICKEKGSEGGEVHSIPAFILICIYIFIPDNNSDNSGENATDGKAEKEDKTLLAWYKSLKRNL